MSDAPILFDLKFQTLPGIILHFYGKNPGAKSEEAGFQTLPGLFCISTGGCCGGLLPQRFQTLPGIILHFYRPSGDTIDTIPYVSKPSGIILHFYEITVQCPGQSAVTVSNPSRDYSAFLPLCGSVNTGKQSVSNPSRDYSAFLLIFKHGRNTPA
jgi:hypothetical protein